ncbi:hypothetical protein TI39_contig53g00018 [Zymoseptoria brevis]|uniref:FAD dependent oxidoreductase domain-containing protein n=1 Tax=Zymoseptoria brevis TaxID=1047168 RepID=A0A0F4GYU9_9PEZI|nr:hypothetical protein TI39_contig53g00018 [Zymoseptoria brevis]
MVEGKETNTASNGITQIIRTPYHQEEYVSLATEAKAIWEKVPPFCEFYQQTGWVQEVSKIGYKPFHEHERIVNADELIQRVGSHILPNLDSAKELWLNGTANAARALEAVAKEATVRGTRREHWDALRLVLEDSNCRGVERTDGAVFTADTTVVATGPWTPAFLHRSGVSIPGNFFEVSAVGVATLTLTDEDYSRFRSMLILSADEGEYSGVDLPNKLPT